MTVLFRCPKRGCHAEVNHVHTTAPKCPMCDTRMIKAQPDAKAPSSKGYVKPGVNNLGIKKEEN